MPITAAPGAIASSAATARARSCMRSFPAAHPSHSHDASHTPIHGGERCLLKVNRRSPTIDHKIETNLTKDSIKSVALVVCLIRKNATQEFAGAIFGVSQTTVSRRWDLLRP